MTRLPIGMLVLLVVSAPSAGARAQTRLEPHQLLETPRPLAFAGPCAGGVQPLIPVGLSEADRAKLDDNPLEALNDRFHQGDFETLQLAARYILDRAACESSGANDAVAYAYRAHHVWLTWVGTDAFETHGVHRVLVSAGMPSPYKLDLPGVRTFYEVFVSSSDKAELTTTLVSTEKADEALAQIPAVVEKVVPVLFGFGQAVGGMVKPMMKDPTGREVTPKLWVTPFRIDLPAKRASIAVTSLAGEPLSESEFLANVSKLTLKASFQTSRCGRELALLQGTALEAARKDQACRPASTRKACLDKFDELLRKAFATQAAVAACATESEEKAMRSVDEAMRASVTGGMAREVKSDFTFSNRPLQRVSFGLMEGIALKAGVNDPRAKLDDDEGTLRADPLPRLLTIVTVNSSFRGYDPTTVNPTTAEKWRWFGGAVIAPDFGLAAGISYLPIRGVAINAGLAGLFIKSVDRAQIGNAPSDATDPFRLGTAWSLFAGVGFNFK